MAELKPIQSTLKSIQAMFRKRKLILGFFACDLIFPYSLYISSSLGPKGFRIYNKLCGCFKHIFCFRGNQLTLYVFSWVYLPNWSKTSDLQTNINKRSIHPRIYFILSREHDQLCEQGCKNEKLVITRFSNFLPANFTTFVRRSADRALYSN